MNSNFVFYPTFTPLSCNSRHSSVLVEMDHQISTTNMADSVDGVKEDVIEKTLFQYFG